MAGDGRVRIDVQAVARDDPTGIVDDDQIRRERGVNRRRSRASPPAVSGGLRDSGSHALDRESHGPCRDAERLVVRGEHEPLILVSRQQCGRQVQGVE